MTDLIERYLHQVGRSLPPKERGEIEAELRSLIQDQLDDRYGGVPTQTEIATVLQEIGDPRRIAASYRSEQYLVGPDLYPYMMVILRRGGLIIPLIVIFLNVFGALTETGTVTWLDVLAETVIGVLSVTFGFFGMVVVIFALVQHYGAEIEEVTEPFNPLEMPEVDDPSNVDRFEAVFGVVAGLFAMLVFLYFLHVGGLTLRFNLSDPGEVIPISEGWMTVMIMVGLGQVAMHLIALRRKRWDFGTWLAQTVLEVFGAICFYFAVTRPLFDYWIANNADLAVLDSVPELFAVLYAVTALINKGITLFRLWNHQTTQPFIVQIN